jgi:hypothetical protein
VPWTKQGLNLKKNWRFSLFNLKSHLNQISQFLFGVKADLWQVEFQQPQCHSVATGQIMTNQENAATSIVCPYVFGLFVLIF